MKPEARENQVTAQSAGIAEMDRVEVRPITIENLRWEVSIDASNIPMPELNFGMRTGMLGTT